MDNKNYWEEKGEIYFLENNKRRKAIVKKCLFCKEKFASRKNKPLKYCSHSCSYKNGSFLQNI